MSEEQARWRIGELADRVAACLTDSYAVSGSRRVRKVPDVRAIRWYTTTGLLDPPIDHRGRVALYGIRHLRQLVAIKRLQGEGNSLTEVQRRLSGISDTQLDALAAIPHALVDGQPRHDDAVAVRQTPEFWKPHTRHSAERYARHHDARDRQLSYGIDVTNDVTILVRTHRPPSQDEIADITNAAHTVVRKLTEHGLTQLGERDDEHHNR